MKSNLVECNLNVPFSKNGLEIKPKIALVNRYTIILGSSLKTSSYHKDRRKFCSFLSTKICKDACLISAVIAIAANQNFKKILCNKSNKQGPE